MPTRAVRRGLRMLRPFPIRLRDRPGDMCGDTAWTTVGTLEGARQYCCGGVARRHYITLTLERKACHAGGPRRAWKDGIWCFSAEAGPSWIPSRGQSLCLHGSLCGPFQLQAGLPAFHPTIWLHFPTFVSRHPGLRQTHKDRQAASFFSSYSAVCAIKMLTCRAPHGVLAYDKLTKTLASVSAMTILAILQTSSSGATSPVAREWLRPTCHHHLPCPFVRLVKWLSDGRVSRGSTIRTLMARTAPPGFAPIIWLSRLFV
ncbi:hypothetical protein N658DRAFT_234365 [Parathielavia hyrcaniae]|uniref:Uncharacterized protein n=1 Tax=Parathielavia hyrcaniae TaxID=113614 RepID=A0AAN6Q5E5_9PEZI|nr:hypothetical protein N658DRAFT_234365 [Parathielavia hyrcaniae]